MAGAFGRLDREAVDMQDDTFARPEPQHRFEVAHHARQALDRLRQALQTLAQSRFGAPVLAHPVFDKRPRDEALQELLKPTGMKLVEDAARVGDKDKAPVSASFDGTSVEAAARLLADMAGLRVVFYDNVVYLTTKDNAASFITDRSGVELRHRVGVENMMWSSDYPHHGNDWPYSRKSIEDSMGNIPAEERAKIVGGNATRIWRLDA